MLTGHWLPIYAPTPPPVPHSCQNNQPDLNLKHRPDNFTSPCKDLQWLPSMIAAGPTPCRRGVLGASPPLPRPCCSRPLHSLCTSQASHANPTVPKAQHSVASVCERSPKPVITSGACSEGRGCPQAFDHTHVFTSLTTTCCRVLRVTWVCAFHFCIYCHHMRLQM